MGQGSWLTPRWEKNRIRKLMDHIKVLKTTGKCSPKLGQTKFIPI